MCALMPMLRYRSMGVTRGMTASEAEVRERTVGLGHPVHFFALLDRTAAAFGPFEEFGGEPLTHRLLAALARSLAQPAHRERHPAHGPYLDRDLEVRAADTAALHLDHRPRVGERLVEHFERVLATALRDLVERAVDDPLGDRLLAARHQHIDELGDVDVRELRIGEDLALRDFSASRHRGLRQDLGFLAPYFDRACLRSLTPAVSSAPRTMW